MSIYVPLFFLLQKHHQNTTHFQRGTSQNQVIWVIAHWNEIVWFLLRKPNGGDDVFDFKVVEVEDIDLVSERDDEFVDADFESQDVTFEGHISNDIVNFWVLWAVLSSKMATRLARKGEL